MRFKEIANKSDHPLYHHLAILSSGGKVLAFGVNRGNIHAERNALNKLLGARRHNANMPRNVTLLSLMFRKRTEKLGNSRPCGECMRAIAPFVKNVVFMEDNSWSSIGPMKLDVLVNL